MVPLYRVVELYGWDRNLDGPKTGSRQKGRSRVIPTRPTGSEIRWSGVPPGVRLTYRLKEWNTETRSTPEGRRKVRMNEPNETGKKVRAEFTMERVLRKD